MSSLIVVVLAVLGWANFALGAEYLEGKFRLGQTSSEVAALRGLSLGSFLGLNPEIEKSRWAKRLHYLYGTTDRGHWVQAGQKYRYPAPVAAIATPVPPSADEKDAAVLSLQKTVESLQEEIVAQDEKIADLAAKVIVLSKAAKEEPLANRKEITSEMGPGIKEVVAEKNRLEEELKATNAKLQSADERLKEIGKTIEALRKEAEGLDAKPKAKKSAARDADKNVVSAGEWLGRFMRKWRELSDSLKKASGVRAIEGQQKTSGLGAFLFAGLHRPYVLGASALSIFGGVIGMYRSRSRKKRRKIPVSNDRPSPWPKIAVLLMISLALALSLVIYKFSGFL